MYVDTHTHLYLDDFEAVGCTPCGCAEVEKALEAGVGHLVFPNVDLSTVKPMKALHDAFPRQTSMAIGLHPTEIKEDWRERLAEIESAFDDGAEYVAVGEIGMDLYWDKTFVSVQMQALELQFQWARIRGLPVIVHCRDGLDQTLEVLEAFPDLKGVMHSFGGTAKDVERIRRTVDFHFGINGVVTFKNCHVRDALPAIGFDRLLLETDSPYLAPVPYRGKRNTSAFLPLVASHIADSVGVSVDFVESATTSAAKDLFGLSLD